MKKKLPLVSIICTAYNHEPYIRQCLEGFAMQKTNFPIEVLISDDASTDKTADIIREYEAKYPEMFVTFYHKENLYSQGIGFFSEELCSNAQGKYIALCEGDDYWTDPLKLQKQVNFMEKNQEFSICFHPVKVIFNYHNRKSYIYPSSSQRFFKSILSADDLIWRNFIQTNSVLYRSRYDEKGISILKNIPLSMLPGDYYIHLLFAKYGKIGFINDVMAVYRRHDGGLWQHDPFYKFPLECRKFHVEVQKLFPNQYKDAIERNLVYLYKSLIESSIKYQDDSKLKTVLNLYPDDIQFIICSYQQILQSPSFKIGKIMGQPLVRGESFLRKMKQWFRDKFLH
ncbi:MAG: glycosyltransferase [Bacteroidales bacterium]